MKRYLVCLSLLGLVLAMPLGLGTVRIWITNSAGASISVINPATIEVAQPIEGFEVPNSIAFSPDGRPAFISEESDDALFVVDTAKGKIVNKVRLSGHPNLPTITKDGKRLYVCIAEDPPRSSVGIVDTATQSIHRRERRPRVAYVTSSNIVSFDELSIEAQGQMLVNGL